MANFSGVHQGDLVEIALAADPKNRTEGRVLQVLENGDPANVEVLLTDGSRGIVIKVIDSEEIIQERIMHEDQFTENKENFASDIMRFDVIPKTVQSFLNSLGGRLYIGVRDQGSLKERLVGIKPDIDLMRKNDKSLSGADPDEKLRDRLELNIMGALNRHLSSDVDIGPLVKIRFPTVCGVQIIEVAIKRSPSPWFFMHVTNRGRPKEYRLSYDGEPGTKRFMDDFYIRRGNGKTLLHTHKEVYDYIKTHYK